MGMDYGKLPPINVGKRLRALREERNVSMRAVARESGLSANALSMIERSLTSPSVSTLRKLAEALEIPITAFFRWEPERTDVVYCKSSDRTSVNIHNGIWEGLGGETFSGNLESFVLTLESGGSSGPQQMMHTGHEFVYCLSGTLEYIVDGTVYILQPGDNLIFAAQIPHSWRTTDEQVQVIIVVSGFLVDERPSEYHLMPDRNQADEQ
jgi:transcriptional regulator with XRE-family HTH domain